MANNLLDQFSQDDLAARLQAEVEVTGEGVSRAVVVPKEQLLMVMEKLLREPDFAFDMLSDLTAVDRKDAGFEIVYQLFSLKHRCDLRVKTRTSAEEAEAPTVTGIWPGADWMEREVFDLMGVTFAGHPNMTRLLLPDEFEGHPLRKDFKLQPRA
ncbi:NADH-quinone oxidoreductase subunit C [Heliomicrobium gestii]|uniref:NADH-quinone oxidoreductase subunit C n=1 Tax=Heliomicrobium gestii TaxID=2699 RepID=UPI001F1D5A70|nr:NADH-quinone oxidoreductase subunit C [Heliomicrobium gestii]MBM7867072.1 NADH-quinone oxidoreductase subunit C [Heliomicrobium gestii]